MTLGFSPALHDLVRGRFGPVVRIEGQHPPAVNILSYIRPEIYYHVEITDSRWR